MNIFQEQFGAPKESTRKKVKPYMEAHVQDFIRQSPFAVMATSDAAGRCDASPKGGNPGFVAVVDDTHLLIPDVPGNRLFQSYENAESNPRVALIFFIPGLNDTVRVNGRIEILNRDEVERVMLTDARIQDDGEKTQQAMLLTVEEAYSHCPRALKFADLWNEDTLRRNKIQSPV